MKRKLIIKSISGHTLLLAFGALLIFGFGAHKINAADPINDGLCDGFTAAGADCSGGEVKDSSIKPVIQKVIEFLSIVVGAVSVIMIIVGGLRYVISNGDTAGLASAKNTILYAIVGLVIVIFAQVIVRFVLTNVTGGTTGTSTPPTSTTPPAPTTGP